MSSTYGFSRSTHSDSFPPGDRSWNRYQLAESHHNSSRTVDEKIGDRNGGAYQVSSSIPPGGTVSLACPRLSRSFPADLTTTRPRPRLPLLQNSSKPASSDDRPSCAPAFIPWLTLT